MLEIQDYIPITKAKNTLLEIIRRVEQGDETIAITKSGIPAAVIMNMERFRGLLETLDILSDEEAMKSLHQSIKEASRGEWRSEKEAFAE